MKRIVLLELRRQSARYCIPRVLPANDLCNGNPWHNILKAYGYHDRVRALWMLEYGDTVGMSVDFPHEIMRFSHPLKRCEMLHFFLVAMDIICVESGKYTMMVKRTALFLCYKACRDFWSNSTDVGKNI